LPKKPYQSQKKEPKHDQKEKQSKRKKGVHYIQLCARVSIISTTFKNCFLIFKYCWRTVHGVPYSMRDELSEALRTNLMKEKQVKKKLE